MSLSNIYPELIDTIADLEESLASTILESDDPPAGTLPESYNMIDDLEASLIKNSTEVSPGTLGEYHR